MAPWVVLLALQFAQEIIQRAVCCNKKMMRLETHRRDVPEKSYSNTTQESAIFPAHVLV